MHLPLTFTPPLFGYASQACPLLLELKDAIVAHGRAKAEQKGKADLERSLERQELWTIGLPKKASAPPQRSRALALGVAQERPSLAKLSSTLLNGHARAAFRGRDSESGFDIE